MPDDLCAAFGQQLAAQRGYLLRFAHLQLRHTEWAEDVVSETLIAALARPQAFESRSQLRTWLVGILKHKVMDVLRQRRKEAVLETHPEDGNSDPMDDLIFTADGHFAHMPADWGDPEQAIHDRQFLAVMDACADKLPPTQGRLFLLREWMELSTEEICEELQLTPNHLYVQLHRARLRLRACLELNWFDAQCTR